MRTRQYDDYDYEEYEFYFGNSANCIDKPNHEYGWIPEHRNIEVTVILSSNYTDLYLLVKGDHKFQLPHKVDIKYEENIDPNPNEIVREYQLVLNKHNHDETTLQFAERHFKQLDVNYIILLKEFDTNYEDFITNNYSFVMDSSRYNMPDLNSKTPLHIYYAFDKIIFMNEWNLVELKEPDETCLTRDFRYSTKGLINTKDNFISVLNRTTYTSPVLTHSTKRTKPTLLKLSPYVDEATRRGLKRIIVAELNTGMFADYLQMHLPGKEILRINKVEGQPFLVKEIVEGVKKYMED